MAQVFLSYDREDGAQARALAQALERAGHFVWWDLHIKGGAEYGKVIEEALEKSDAVIVLWSAASINSAWVRDEAASGRDAGKLIPILIESVSPPMGFRQYQNLDFTSWKGRGKPPRLAELMVSIEAQGGTAPAEPRPVSRASDAETATRALPRWFAVGGVVILALVAIGLFVGLVLNDRRKSGGTPTIAVTASDTASRPLARELLAKLSTLQGTGSESMRLLGQDGDLAAADFIFEAAGSGNQGQTGASLVLLTGRDREILWSKDFEQPSGKRADLLQQLAYTAARVTGCTLEGLDGPVRLKPDLLKIYLNACAQLSEIATADPRPPIPMLAAVIEKAPRFTPAWSKLLLAESAIVTPEFTGAEPDVDGVAKLRRRIAEARKIDPAMPEAAIAEAQLLSQRDFAGRAQRIKDAAAQRPDDPVVLNYLAGSLSKTGRLREAVEVAARAVQLDPLSPSVHSSYTALLAYSGNPGAARRELAKAERLWPGTASLLDAQYRFHLRYGDPKIAKAIFDQQSDSAGKAPRLYLEAREDPTSAKVEALMTYVHERLRNMENPSAGVGFATLAFGHFGRTEDVFATLLNWPRVDDLATIAEIFFRPEFTLLRRDPRFLLIAKRAGLLEYWRKSGKWPDFCFDPDQPYDCKAEAAKLS